MLHLCRMIFVMSLEAAMAVCTVCVLRFALRKQPKGFTCALWLLVLFRLLCPVTVTSGLSLMPDIRAVQEVRADYGEGGQAAYPTGQQGTGQTKLPGTVHADPGQAEGSERAAVSAPGDGLRRFRAAAVRWGRQAALGLNVLWVAQGEKLSFIWAMGVFLLFMIHLIRYYGWKKKTAGARIVRQYAPAHPEPKPAYLIKQGSCIEEPFVSGIFRPVIYLPDGLEEKEREYILCHEKNHIRHHDPLLRLLWQAALVIHWFNPLVWLAVKFVQKDMEMFCDESVVRKYGNGARREYAMALLHFAAKKSGLTFPVAFGESNAENRISHILKLKRPALAGAVLAAFVIVAASAVLLTNPKRTGEQEVIGETETRQEETVERTTEEADDEKGKSEDRAELLLELGESWGKAFCGRDGAAMAALLSDPLKMEENGYEKMADGSYDVGWSSPWPWGDDFRINYAYDRDEIILYYYALTSDPTVTLWKQVLTAEEHGGEYRVADWTTEMEPVSSAAGFRERYHYEPQDMYGFGGQGYRFRDTPLDWFWSAGIYEESTLAGVLLLQEVNETEGNIKVYQTPETAAARQLNLEGGRAVRVESPDSGKICLRWEFDDGRTDIICLKRAGLLPDNSGRESSLWLVEDILEEPVWLERLAFARLREYYEGAPQKLAESGLRGTDGLMQAQQGEEGAVLLAETTDGSVSLYGLVVNGRTCGIFLTEADDCQYLDLMYTSSQSVLPVMEKADYDGDGQEELAVVLHVDTGTEYSVEQLLFLEKRPDGGWTAQEYLPEDYLAQLNTEVEFVYEKETVRMRCTELKQNLLLGEEDLTPVLPGGEETVGITLGNLVYFSLEGGKISIRIWPRIQVEDWPIGFYGESVLQARVNYDGGSFRLSDFEIIRKE